MKSGLGDRNNSTSLPLVNNPPETCLNEVRSWRPEQSDALLESIADLVAVSMKSGLGDRNNWA